jgi:hypothetical protein
MQQLSGATLADQLTLLFTLYEVFVSVTKSKESFDQFFILLRNVTLPILMISTSILPMPK